MILLRYLINFFHNFSKNFRNSKNDSGTKPRLPFYVLDSFWSNLCRTNTVSEAANMRWKATSRELLKIGAAEVRCIVFSFIVGSSKLLFCAIFLRIWKAKSSSQMERFFTRCLTIAFTPHRQFCSRFWREVFLNQFVTNLPLKASEIVIFSKRSKFGSFFEKNGYFGKFFEVAKGGKFAVECVSNGIISDKWLFRRNYETFLAKK